MIGYITPQRIANSIQQDTSFKGVYLLIEGNNDYLLFNKFIEKSSCQIKIAHGYVNIIESISILQNRGFEYIVGIIDADFNNIHQEITPTKNIFLTDYHDIELMVFNSEAFNNLLHNYSKPDKLNKYLQESGKHDFKQALLDLIKPLGYLRWANKRFNLGLSFKPKLEDGNPLSYANFISQSGLTYLGDEVMLRTVINYSRNRGINTTEQEALTKLKEVLNETLDLLQICNGHDIFNVLSIALRKTISNLNAVKCQSEQLEKETILAYDSRFFEQTKLYSLIKDWEQKYQKTILKF